MISMYVSAHSTYFLPNSSVVALENIVVMTATDIGFSTTLKEFSAETVTIADGDMKCSCGAKSCVHQGEAWMYLAKTRNIHSAADLHQLSPQVRNLEYEAWAAQAQ